ncbi:MAG TPA: type II toxin-antitoxin system HicA family toxin [bacterium]|nr:type II toxin-antitoxin system HicA family toxin [bacterium]
MNSTHRKTLAAIFERPTRANILFADIEALVIALGGKVKEGAGSRIALRINDAVKHAHRPHPGKEAKKYHIDEIREWLKAQGITP